MRTNCGCQTTTPCQTTQCGCQAIINSDCLNNVKSNFECLDIASGQTLTATLEQMDAQICQLFDSVTNYFTLINVGTGAGVYKGVNLLGQKELKSLVTASNIITITSSTNEITFSINTANLNTYIQAQQLTYSVSNLGTEGEGVFASSTLTGNNRNFGLKRIKSNTLTITATATEISIENPTEVDTDIRRFIVNSAYTGDEVTGSISKPYKTIQEAVTDYIGAGTAQEPEFKNSEIVIQKGSGYIYTGTFNFNTGTGSVILEEGTGITSNPTGDWLCDFDTLSDTQSANFNLVLREGSLLQLLKNGFKNRGTSVNNGLITTVKNIFISGGGTIFQAINDNTNITYTVFESNFVGTDTFYNDSGATFNLRGITARSRTQQLIKIGGNSEFLADNIVFQSETTNANIKLFNQIGGRLRINNTTFNFLSASPNVFFSLTKNSSSLCNVDLVDCILNVITTTLFQNENTNQSVVILRNVKTQFSTITNIAKSPNVLWTNCIIQNCIFGSGAVDQTQVDLTAGNTISTTNIFNNKVVESLQVFSSRVSAVATGLRKGDAFINRKTVNAGSFVIGEEYVILSVGSTDFVAVGASANTVGLNFTATGVGTGNGTVYKYIRDIIL